MRTFYLFLILIFTTTLTSAQENVLFLHGILSKGSTWTKSDYNMIANLKTSWNMNAINPDRNDKVNFSMQADACSTALQYSNSSSWIAVGHSMGGLAARTYVKKYWGASKINRIVTIGTPHKGALIAQSLYNDQMSIFLTDQAQAIFVPLGTLIEYISNGIPFIRVNQVLNNLKDFMVDQILVASFPAQLLQNPAMYDLRPGSTGIANLQSAESFDRVGIIGRQNDNAHEFYRLMFTGAGLNSDEGVTAQKYLIAAWDLAAYYCISHAVGLAEDGYELEAEFMLGLADEFKLGAKTIAQSSWKWKRNINGSFYPNSSYQWGYGPSDGIVPEHSQDYPNANKEKVSIIGKTNHLQMTNTERAKKAIDIAFSSVNFVNSPTPVTFTAGITPTSAQTPAGGSYVFSANITGGSGNYTIDWYSYYSSSGGGGGGPIAQSKNYPMDFVPEGPDQWIYIKTGTQITFSPSSRHQLQIRVRDNLSGQIITGTIRWY